MVPTLRTAPWAPPCKPPYADTSPVARFTVNRSRPGASVPHADIPDPVDVVRLHAFDRVVIRDPIVVVDVLLGREEMLVMQRQMGFDGQGLEHDVVDVNAILRIDQVSMMMSPA